MSNEHGSQTRLTLLSRLRQEPTNEAAWTEFLARYEHRVRAWCLGWGLQDADAADVTQNVLLQLSRKMRTFQYDPSGSFRAYLKTLTRHAWKDLIEERKKKGVASGDSAVQRLLEDMQADSGLVECLKEQFDLEVLEEAQTRVQWRVDVQSWEAFRLTALEDIPGAEAAQHLGMTVAAVYKAKSRILKMLQEEVQRVEQGSSAGTSI
jgi:RNA polymerase sigma-70 factor (ECF subfamily)